jgi:mRNA interferase HigB
MRTLRSMRILKRGAPGQFWRKHADSKSSLESWYLVVRKAGWQTPAELKQVYPNADLVGRRTVFTISGNKYRWICRGNDPSERVFVLCILTHAE